MTKLEQARRESRRLTQRPGVRKGGRVPLHEVRLHRHPRLSRGLLVDPHERADGHRRVLAVPGPEAAAAAVTTLRIHPNGGRFGSDLARLRTMGVITERGPIAVTEALHR